MTFSIAAPVYRHYALGALSGAILALLVNVGILAFGVGDEPATAPYPGPINTVIYAIVPFVWIALFAANAAAIVILRSYGRVARLPAAAATVLLINCALYPVYTLGFSAPLIGLAGNGLTAVLAAFAAGTSIKLAPGAAALLVPVIVWVSLASAGLVAVLIGQTF
jgi:tryptophan-rich sensory protein